VNEAELARRLAGVDRQIKLSLRELAALPQTHFRAVVPVLMKAQRETERVLEDFAAGINTSEKFSHNMARQLFVELAPVMDEVERLDPVLYKALTDGRDSARSLAVDHIRRQLAVEDPQGVRLPIAKAAAIAEGRATRIAMYERSAERYAGAVGDDIRGQISLGLLRGETFDEMTERLMDLDIFDKYRYWAERIVRTEVVEQYNSAASDEVEELHKEDPEILSRWDASLDERMCEECEDLDGETTAPGEDFKDGVDHPPLHPGCRCAVTAWREDWKND
jgi:SPP1 gp7 family putative phage head morphogenesis protein